MTMRLPLLYNNYATLVSVYAPTMTNPDEAKERFYQQLDDLIQSVPRKDKLIVMGDLNARVGTDHTAWTDIIGKHGIGNENSNGKLLLSICARHSLSITNTFFQLNTVHKVTWMHPRSKHWHQIDHIILQPERSKGLPHHKSDEGCRMLNRAHSTQVKSKSADTKEKKATGQETSKETTRGEDKYA